MVCVVIIMNIKEVGYKKQVKLIGINTHNIYILSVYSPFSDRVGLKPIIYI